MYDKDTQILTPGNHVAPTGKQNTTTSTTCGHTRERVGQGKRVVQGKPDDCFTCNRGVSSAALGRRCGVREGGSGGSPGGGVSRATSARTLRGTVLEPSGARVMRVGRDQGGGEAEVFPGDVLGNADRGVEEEVSGGAVRARGSGQSEAANPQHVRTVAAGGDGDGDEAERRGNLEAHPRQRLGNRQRQLHVQVVAFDPNVRGEADAETNPQVAACASGRFRARADDPYEIAVAGPGRKAEDHPTDDPPHTVPAAARTDAPPCPGSRPTGTRCVEMQPCRQLAATHRLAQPHRELGRDVGRRAAVPGRYPIRPAVRRVALPSPPAGGPARQRPQGVDQLLELLLGESIVRPPVGMQLASTPPERPTDLVRSGSTPHPQHHPRIPLHATSRVTTPGTIGHERFDSSGVA